jgi:hypothetical protein
MRHARKSARALEILVDSPGRVGKKPFSVTYSSSASTGYSQCTSSSFMSLGNPSCAAEKLQRSATCKSTDRVQNLPIYRIK